MALSDDDPLGVRADFPITSSRTYLNTPYIGPISTVVRDAAVAYTEEKLGWAASRHQLETQEQARNAFAALFGAKINVLEGVA